MTNNYKLKFDDFVHDLIMSLLTVAKEFVLIPQHTTPSNATKEIDELYDVFVDVRKRWNIEVWWWISYII